MINWLNRPVIDPEIELNGISVPIILRRHSTAKRLTLRLAPDASEVRLTLPQWAHENEAIAFLIGFDLDSKTDIAVFDHKPLDSPLTHDIATVRPRVYCAQRFQNIIFGKVRHWVRHLLNFNFPGSYGLKMKEYQPHGA